MLRKRRQLRKPLRKLQNEQGNVLQMVSFGLLQISAVALARQAEVLLLSRFQVTMGNLIKRWMTISMLNINLVSAAERCAMTIFEITISIQDLISLQRVVFLSLTVTAPPTPCCLCCGPRLVVNCCNICHPMYFRFAVAELSDKALKPPQKLMPKAYECGPAEESLRKDLISLWQDLAKDEALMLTAKALMPDSLLDHIVDLTHY
jgi:hypothetical protein